jgi:hypothetical protein
MAGCLKFHSITHGSHTTNGKSCLHMAKLAKKWQHLSTHGNTCLQYQLPITKWPHQSEAPVGAAPPTRSQLRLQMAAAIAYNGKKSPPTTTVDCKRQKLRTHMATLAYKWQQ